MTAVIAALSGDAARLMEGLKREAALYADVLTVSEEELKLVRAAELERATVSLTRKQQVLEEIGTIEAGIKPLKEQWPAIRAALGGGAQSQFADVLKRLSDLLERLIAVERETEEILSRQIDVVKKKWPAAGAEERARKAYGAHREPEGSR